MLEQTKEKIRELVPKNIGISKALSPIAVIGAFVAALVVTNAKIGGMMSPFAPSLTAALPPAYSLAAFVGSVTSGVVSGELLDCLPELAAAFVMMAFGMIFYRHSPVRLTAIISGIVYFICSCAALSAGGDWVMFLALFFRGALCGTMTLCISECVRLVKYGYHNEQDAALRLAAAGAFFMLIISSLSSAELFILNLGRIAAGFAVSAMARKYGVSGGGAAGIMSAAAFLLADSSLGRSGAMLAFSGMVAGLYQPKGKYAVNIAFIGSAFAITAAAGMPSGTPEFIADMGAAAILYCLVPEGLYMPFLNGICAEKKKDGGLRADRIAFAAGTIEEVGRDAAAAADMLVRASQRNKSDAVYVVKSRVCSRFCGQGRCTAAGCCNSDELPDSVFRTAQNIAEKKGSITVKDLPTGFEGCTKKVHIADSFSYAASLDRLNARREIENRRVLESSCEHIGACCSVLYSAAAELKDGMREDTALTDSACKLICENIDNVRSVSVELDGHMRPFVEAFAASEKELPYTMLSGINTGLAALLGCSVDEPEQFCSMGTVRLRWQCTPKYSVDHSVYSSAAENGICGDSCKSFCDGRGRFYLILADGMGRGGRAAAQSSMAVNLLRRLILSGTEVRESVRLLDMLMSGSPDEMFTTLDITQIDLYSGSAYMYKLGAAPTAVLTRDGDGIAAVDYYSSQTAPLGIISDPEISVTELSLNDSSRILMMTDGVDSSCYTYINALLENERLTCEQIAERIIAKCEEYSAENADDMTAAAIRLYEL